MATFVLCIGCNYFGQGAELAGCVNDANLMSRLWAQRLGDRAVENVVMTDDVAADDFRYPTKRNIIAQLNRIKRMAHTKQIQQVALHFSGHGSWRRDRNGDENDGRDETILPVDFQRSGEIVDDWFQQRFLAKLPAQTRVFCVFDSCHSGTFADQKFVYQPAGRGRLRRRRHNRRVRSMRPHAVISGCVDKSYSYDDYDAEFGATGACTVAFARAFQQTTRLGEIVQLMRQRLGRRQRPQLSASFAVNSATRVPVQ